ncbi:MAG: preprotein translocase subunit SecE [Chloroflexi bacterium]|nr:preprotein translocase subunit SecE [Chloroflexota bacterium]
MTKIAKRQNPIAEFLRETRSELRKVVWPSRQDAIRMTLIVIAVTLGMATLLGLIDYLFTVGFSRLIDLLGGPLL